MSMGKTVTGAGPEIVAPFWEGSSSHGWAAGRLAVKTSDCGVVIAIAWDEGTAGELNWYAKPSAWGAIATGATGSAANTGRTNRHAQRQRINFSVACNKKRSLTAGPPTVRERSLLSAPRR